MKDPGRGGRKKRKPKPRLEIRTVKTGLGNRESAWQVELLLGKEEMRLDRWTSNGAHTTLNPMVGNGQWTVFQGP